MSLDLGRHLRLPLKFLSLRKVVFGGSGSGKTSCGRVIFEEAAAAGVLCGAIDLKGDFWGLKSSADGKSDGIPVVIFGGEHKDVPLDEAGGASLADIVVELRQPFVVDLEELSKGKQLRFLGAFFERLYDRNREPLVLICDEADRYASQKPMSPEANICLGATEDIAKRGRKHGIFPVFITQRNASLNKGVSELCDVAIVFRTPGPRDQAAVEDWFGTKATREQRDEVMGKLAGLPTGTAVVCSAHPDMKLFDTAAVRQPWTFDSSATPEIGKRRIEPKRLAKPDLKKLEERMRATIERVRADDPRELRRRIGDLERELRNKDGNKKSLIPEPKRVEVPALKDSQVKRLEVLFGRVVSEADRHGKAMAMFWENQDEQARALLDALKSVWEGRKTTAFPPALVIPISGRVRQRSGSGEGPAAVDCAESGKLSGPERKILTALAQYGSRSHTALALLTRYASSGGAFRNPLSALRSKGYVEGDRGQLRMTDAGERALGGWTPLPTGRALLDYWLGHLPGPDAKLLRAVAERYPKPIALEALAEATEYAVTGGAFRNPLSRLRTLELVSGRGEVTAARELFEEVP